MRRLSVIALTVAVFSAAPAHTAPENNKALQLIQAYNGRPFGSPGWRRVRLELRNGATVTRTFVVTNVWREEGSTVRTLFVLEQPENLAGTNYLLVEEPESPAGMKVFLHLPAGRRRVLSIQPSQFDEGLLGSDFGYRDLRMKIPAAGFQLRLLERHRLLGRSAWAVEAVPVDPETRAASSWARSVYYLAEGDPVLLGADHFRAATDRKPAKQMRVQGIKKIEGAWTETQITMTSSDGRSSILSLLDFHAALADLDAALFNSETLPAVAGRILRLQPGRSRP
jgi:hypothetical protein